MSSGQTQLSIPRLPHTGAKLSGLFFTDPSSPYPGLHRRMAGFPRRLRYVFLVIAVVVYVTLYTIRSKGSSNSQSTVAIYGNMVFSFGTRDKPSLNVTMPASSSVNAKQLYSPWVLGPPTESFRDNLRPDIKYITSWLDAGWSTYIQSYIG